MNLGLHFSNQPAHGASFTASKSARRAGRKRPQNVRNLNYSLSPGRLCPGESSSLGTGEKQLPELEPGGEREIPPPDPEGVPVVSQGARRPWRGVRRPTPPPTSAPDGAEREGVPALVVLHNFFSSSWPKGDPG